MRTLVLGVGNVDRQDDGVAWYAMVELMKQLGQSIPVDYDSLESSDPTFQFIFQLQLMPELATDLADFDRVCFIDAHTGAVPEPVHVEIIRPAYQHSPLTHHMTAQSLLEVTRTINGKAPDAILVSIRGYKFGFQQGLSPETQALVAPAVEIITEWVKNP